LIQKALPVIKAFLNAADYPVKFAMAECSDTKIPGLT
jgi:hypothetical protein